MARLTALRSVSCSAALLLLAAAPFAMAGNKDDLMAGVQKLDDAASYSWSSTTTGGRGGGGSEGKTQKDGPTLITVQGRNGPMQVVMMGDQTVAQTQDGWQNLSEMQNGQGGGRMAGMLRNMSTPASQAKTYLKDVEDVSKADDGSFSVDLPEDAAKRMLSFGGGRRGGGGGGGAAGGGAAGGGAAGGGGPQVSNAKASAKYWLNSDGVLNKMELHVTGTVSFNGNDRDVDRTTTTEIKDIGSTTVDVPADAKAKLSGGGGATSQPAM